MLNWLSGIIYNTYKCTQAKLEAFLARPSNLKTKHDLAARTRMQIAVLGVQFE